MNPEPEDEIRDEYDLAKLKRIPNPFHQRFEDLNLVSLDDDVKEVFPDSEAVNTALRLLIKAGNEARKANSLKLPKAS